MSITKQPHKPCPECPFLYKNDNVITPARKYELYEGFLEDGHFQCHHTLDYNDCDEDGEPNTHDGRICAGSIIACDKAGMGMSQLARIASRLGLLDLALVDWKDPNVVDVADWGNEMFFDNDDEDEDYYD